MGNGWRRTDKKQGMPMKFTIGRSGIVCFTEQYYTANGELHNGILHIKNPHEAKMLRTGAMKILHSTINFSLSDLSLADLKI